LNWKDAEEEFRRAIELNPSSAAAHYLYAFSLLVPEKRFDQALEEIPPRLVARSSLSHHEHELRHYVDGCTSLSGGARPVPKDSGARPEFRTSPSQASAVVRRDWRLRERREGVAKVRSYTGIVEWGRERLS